MKVSPHHSGHHLPIFGEMHPADVSDNVVHHHNDAHSIMHDNNCHSASDRMNTMHPHHVDAMPHEFMSPKHDQMLRRPSEDHCPRVISEKSDTPHLNDFEMLICIKCGQF